MKGCRCALFSLFSQLVHHKVAFVAPRPPPFLLKRIGLHSNLYLCSWFYFQFCVCNSTFSRQLLLSTCCLQLSVYLYFLCVCLYLQHLHIVTIVFATPVFGAIVFATIVYLQQLYLVMTRVLCRLSPLIVALPPDSTADAACCLLFGAGTRVKKEDKCAVRPTVRVSSSIIKYRPFDKCVVEWHSLGFRQVPTKMNHVAHPFVTK